LFPLVLDI